MFHALSAFALLRRGRATTRLALFFLFVLTTAFSVNYASLLPQTCALEPSNNVSAGADDLTRESALGENTDSLNNSDEIESVRIVRRDGALSSLETSIVTFKGKYQASDDAVRDVTVDLIGAIHIAEDEYYQKLNEIFKNYDAVVFELVTDSDGDLGAIIQESREKKKKEQSLNPLNLISYFQESAGQFLRLSYQIDGIDYLAPNLRRGDCTPLEFIGWLFTNGDVADFLAETFARSFLESVPGSTEGAVVSILCSKDKRLATKRLFALELADSSLGDVKNEYRALGKNNDDSSEPRENAIIHLRNKKALAVVRQELDAGRSRVALFFGAAHLPDLGLRLESDFGLTRQPDVQWLKAWNLD